MRTTLIVITAVGVWLAGPGAAQAGVYNSNDPPALLGPSPSRDGVVHALPLSAFRSLLTDWLKISLTTQDSELRKAYLKQRDALLAKEQAGTATVDDLVNLGACFIRLGDPVEAATRLRQATAQDRRNFRAAANLATAHQMTGDWTTAIDYLHHALDNWPAEAPGLSRQQLEWFQRAETYHLKLLRLRAREAAQQPPGARKPPASVDDLFEVRFVGESGQYEAGQLAAQQRKKLPPDAVAIVQQLLIWQPGDTRLYWLLGELLNAEGKTAEADIVLKECVDGRGYNVPELLEHRRILDAARPDAVAPADPDAVVRPLPSLDRVAVVSGIVGLVALVLVYLQLREIRRRRQGSPTAKNC